jgi:uncharacterized protein YtpQ (UPF0354 family)
MRKMKSERKIQPVVKKLSFAEAEEEDNIYWANKTGEERLSAAMDLREIFFGMQKPKSTKVAKVVFKRTLYEEG